METIELLAQIKRSHDRYNRLLTVALAAAVCLAGVLLWRGGVPLLDEHKPGVGLAIMFLALVFYKIPYIAYRLNRRRYAADADGLRLMGANWRQYRARIMQQAPR